MKSISIKFFTIIAVLFLLLGLVLTFLNFYRHSKANISELLTTNIQSESLNIKHFLDANLKKNNIHQITAQLDSITSSNSAISNIHIINNEQKLLYSSDRSTLFNGDNCTPISAIDTSSILSTKCYSFSIKLYKGLEPYYYTSNIFIDEEYLNNLLSKQTIQLIIYFSLFTFFFFFFLWIVLNKTIILPLEKLRQYAYYSNETPKEFFINELESIRYSLSITFSRLKKEQEELYKLSTKDPLSGLYNRMSLIEKIEWLISNNDRSHQQFAVIFIDLDNFKTINDSRGHNFGDKVLQNVAQSLLKLVRDNDIVSRIGGDEFVLVLPDLPDETRVVEVLERIKTKLSIPISLENYKYNLTASMGVSIYPRDGKDVHTLLKHSDIAMYKSKDLGKNNYHFFTEELNNVIQEKVKMQNLMIEALQKGHFKLFYQPKTDVKTGEIHSCEALIRLIDPIDGLIPPDSFIPLAEENNFIIPLGAWVIQESVRQLKLWQNTPLSNMKISINVSAKQFKDPDFLNIIKSALKDVDSSLLDIELTESVFVEDFNETYETIQEMKKLGLSLSLDDFGTGYSSLSYLKRIPFDTIKIDKSFIDDLNINDEKTFVNMIVDVAKTLHFQIVAEGVETQEQLSYLKKVNCDLYQGYLCSKPLPVYQFEALIKSMYFKN